jgi:hypothetical protein
MQIKTPKSTLSASKSIQFCRGILCEGGVDVTDLVKAGDVVEYVIEYLDSCPSLIANVATAKEMRDKLNFVVDALNV